MMRRSGMYRRTLDRMSRRSIITTKALLLMGVKYGNTPTPLYSGYKSVRWEEIDFGVMIAPMGMNTYAAPHLESASYGASSYWSFAKSSDLEKVLEDYIDKDYSEMMLDALESANHDYVAMDFRESNMKEPKWTNTAMHKVKVPDHEAKEELDFQIGMVAHIMWKNNKLVMPGSWWQDVIRKMNKKDRANMQPVELLLSDLLVDAPDFGWLWFEF